MTDPAVAKAMAAVEAAVDKAKRDRSRPAYHFRPPAQWMNDPNGTIYHNGYYHLFYQHNPYSDWWGYMHWGHARSRDLVRWEHLPIALCPSGDRGETSCFSGCAAIDASGRPLLLYTSIGERDPEQWIAVGDAHLIEWQKPESNPVLTMRAHGDIDITEWRDPFVFRDNGRVFMLVGGKLSSRNGGEPVCLIYESVSGDFQTWQYRGIFYRHPKRDYPHFECPNLCKLGGKWVLLSAFELTTIEYAVGDIDWRTYAFMPQHMGTVDHGCKDDSAFYATNLLAAPDGRTILFGWVRGFKRDRGWGGVQSLPRVLAVNGDGELLQTPAVEVESLRGSHVELGAFTVDGTTRMLDNVGGDCIELALTADISHAEAFTLEVRRSLDGRSSAPIRYQDGVLDVYRMPVPVPHVAQSGVLELRIFLDRAVMEVFADGGRACCTRTIYKREDDIEVALTALGGPVQVKSFDVWQMKAVWKD